MYDSHPTDTKRASRSPEGAPRRLVARSAGAVLVARSAGAVLVALACLLSACFEEVTLGRIARDAGPAEGDGGDGGSVDSRGKFGIRFRSSGERFNHQDSLAGQTPSVQEIAITYVDLYRDASDPDPVRILDFGVKPKVLPIQPGADNAVGELDLESVPPATYRVARIGISWVRYRVAATLHAAGIDSIGELEGTHALSQGAVIDNVARAQRYAKIRFFVGSSEVSSRDVPTSPMPAQAAGGGIELDLSRPDGAYVVSVLLPVAADLRGRIDVVFELNVDECFRWQDESMPGYQVGVFDVTASAFEPVVHFGANAFDVKAFENNQ